MPGYLFTQLRFSSVFFSGAQIVSIWNGYGLVNNEIIKLVWSLDIFLPSNDHT